MYDPCGRTCEPIMADGISACVGRGGFPSSGREMQRVQICYIIQRGSPGLHITDAPAVRKRVCLAFAAGARRAALPSPQISCKGSSWKCTEFVHEMELSSSISSRPS
ncbi:unnamed protein product [Symbiodinium sp. KB8]|nr:unnamed protein product [Symbiodinium sp. KB8]